MDISILIMALNEEKNIPILVNMLHAQMKKMSVSYEIVVIDGNSSDNTKAFAEAAGARVELQKIPGYGSAFRQGLSACAGEYILAIDADLSHEPSFIPNLWNARNSAELVIASRFINKSASFEAPFYRAMLSRFCNKVFKYILSLPVEDMSSGFRLYKGSVVRSLVLEGKKFDILEEALIKIFINGYRVAEIPFSYKPREKGHSNFSLLKFVNAYMVTMFKMWRLRSSIAACDYDYRAYYSRIPLQRYWQRRRYNVIRSMIDDPGKGILDIGCGSGKIVLDLKMIGCDIARNKLRFNLKFNKMMACGSINNIPFKDGFFQTVICSEVIEHIPKDKNIILQIKRVLTENGILILGTPDYGGWQWPLIEYFYGKLAPGGYAEEHISKYTRGELVNLLKEEGFSLLEEKYILRGEMILKFQLKK